MAFKQCRCCHQPTNIQPWNTAHIIYWTCKKCKQLIEDLKSKKIKLFQE